LRGGVFCSFSFSAKSDVLKPQAQNEPKEKAPFPLVLRTTLRFSPRAGRAKTRFAQTVCAPDRPCSAMLGFGTTGLAESVKRLFCLSHPPTQNPEGPFEKGDLGGFPDGLQILSPFAKRGNGPRRAGFLALKAECRRLIAP